MVHCMMARYTSVSYTTVHYKGTFHNDTAKLNGTLPNGTVARYKTLQPHKIVRYRPTYNISSKLRFFHLKIVRAAPACKVLLYSVLNKCVLTYCTQ
jgi:hypothetical protein